MCIYIHTSADKAMAYRSIYLSSHAYAASLSNKSTNQTHLLQFFFFLFKIFHPKIILHSLNSRYQQSRITYPNHMAMEQYLQESVPRNNFNKEDDASLKWKSSTESVDESENGPSGGFDCNICLDTVHDPVVTLCGHLYCWPCIYKWIHHQRTTSEYPDKKNVQCPVCKSEISQKTIVPLYGRGRTTEPLSDEKGSDVGIMIPRRPPSPRCGLHTISGQQLNHRNHQQVPPMAITMPGLGGMTMTNMINPTSPTTGMLGEIVYERIFGNSHPSLFAYPNSYNLAGMSTQRARRQAMQADRSLNRICFFLLCCVMLCLVLF